METSEYDEKYLQYQKLLQAVKDYKREIVSPTPDAKLFDSSTPRPDREADRRPG
ncbi:MAG: hypothetical protein ACLR8P_13975 [Clostridium fessum]